MGSLPIDSMGEIRFLLLVFYACSRIADYFRKMHTQRTRKNAFFQSGVVGR